MSECSFRWAGDEFEEALPVVTLWGRRWTRPELLARVGRLEQVAGMRLVEVCFSWVFSGFGVSLVHHGPPNSPRSPDPPR